MVFLIPGYFFLFVPFLYLRERNDPFVCICSVHHVKLKKKNVCLLFLVLHLLATFQVANMGMEY
jgi:hypothetical protein